MEIQRSSLLNPTTTQTDDDDDNDIPDWLLFEVLLRLPINSVFKCRIVSKQWLSIASDPVFIQAYANSRASSSSSQQPWIVLSSASLHVRDPTAPITFEHNPSNHRDMHLRPHSCTIQRGIEGLLSVLGVSNGLVLYGYYERKPEFGLFDFCVCNPITGHHIRPPKPVELPPSSHAWAFLTSVTGDFVLRSYRIVHAMQQPMENLDDIVIIFSVYYSEIGDWKKFTVPLRSNEPMTYRLELQQSAAVVDGILYWVDRSGSGVVVYDPEANPEQARLIEEPYDPERPHCIFNNCLCVEHRGELIYFGGYLCIGKGLQKFSIWKLEDSDSGEWLFRHKIGESTGGIIDDTMFLDTACFDPFDSDVMYLINEHKFFSYNLKSGALDDQCELMIKGDGPFMWLWYFLPQTHFLSFRRGLFSSQRSTWSGLEESEFELIRVFV